MISQSELKQIVDNASCTDHKKLNRENWYTDINYKNSKEKSIDSQSDLALDALSRCPQAATPSLGYLEQDVGKFFYRWGGLLSATLIRIRGRFQGDLDQYLLYLVFLLAELSQQIAASEAEARGARPPTQRPRGLNALSIAEITRVPRETTRRKLQALLDRGYLVRGPDGLYYLGEEYGMDAFFFDLSPLFWDAVRVPR